MEETPIYYKVTFNWPVSSGNPRHFSSIVHDMPTFAVEYIPGIPTFPRIGKLFLFETLWNAKEYTRCFSHDRFTIWACTGTGVVLPYSIYAAPITLEMITAYWNDLKNSYYRRVPMPEGTLWADSITLLNHI